MEIGLSLQQYMVPQSDGTSAGPTPLQPLAGVLDAANVVVLGASIFEGAFEDGTGVTPALQAYATAAGFTGTLHSYATGGHQIADTIAQHALAQANLAATQGSNLYLVHSGGNNVTAGRPYPGAAGTFAADYTTLMNNITATDPVIPMPLTKRLYGIGSTGYPTNPTDVAQGDAASEINGSAPYNDAIILPAIASAAPDWLDAGGAAYVDPYVFVDDDPDLLASDGVHGPGGAIARYVLAKVAGRALGIAADSSRAGQSLVYNIKAGDPNLTTIGPVNTILSYTDGAQNNPLFYGAVATDGTFDPHIKARMGAFKNGSSGMDASCYPRLADPRFHDTSIVGDGIYVQGTQTFALTFDGLTPGDSVVVSCCGVRTAGGTNRSGDMTLSDGQVQTLNGASDAASNQAVFNPLVVPADGRVTLTLSVTSGATYAYLHGVILDF